MDIGDDWTRPTRGGIRFDQMSWSPAALQADLARFDADEWIPLGGDGSYGEEWDEIPLIKPSKSKDGGTVNHDKLESCPTFLEVANAFPGRVIDMTMARLSPGGWVQEHRDISGGTAMGVARFHVPVVTHPDVEFYINRSRVFMDEGEVWNLDTTYLHQLNNRSDVRRVHLILDVAMTDEIRAMFPATDMVDRLHTIHFAGVCVQKGLGLMVTNPRGFVARVRKFVALRFFGKSSLFEAE